MEETYSPISNGHGNGNGINHQHLTKDMSSDEALKKIRTGGSISISPELFEKLYLSPQNRVKGELRKTFANPTPMFVFQREPKRIKLFQTNVFCSAIVGFIMCLGPLSCDLMGWRGAGGGGAASM